MADLIGNLLAGATVEIETAVTPAVRVPVDSVASGTSSGPGLFTKLLRPVVVVRRGDTVILRVEPAGQPDRAVQTVAAACLLMLLLWVVFRIAAR